MRKNILYTLLFGSVMEFQINILLKHNLGGMLGVLILYSAIGVMTYYTFPWLMRLRKTRSQGFWLALIVHGLAGLCIIEWGFMKNIPAHIPLIWLSIISQLGMFAWWSTIASMPYLLRQHEALPLRKSIIRVYIGYGIISTILALMFGMAPIILLEPPVYLFFFTYYRKFAKHLV